MDNPADTTVSEGGGGGVPGAVEVHLQTIERTRSENTVPLKSSSPVTSAGAR